MMKGAPVDRHGIRTRTTFAVGVPSAAALSVGLAAGCFALDQWTEFIEVPHTGIAAVGPSAGLAVAAVVMFGWWTFPAVVVGYFFANLEPGVRIVVCAALALVFSVQCGAAAWLLKRREFREGLDSPRDIAVIAAIALACPLGGATAAALIESAGEEVTSHTFLLVLSSWLVRDGTAILILVPAILGVVAMVRERGSSDKRWKTELVLTVLVFSTLATANFVTDIHVNYLLFAFGTLIAIRSRTLGAILTATLLWGIAIPTTAHHLGPFANAGSQSRFFQVESLAASFAVMVYALAATNNGRDRANRQVREDKRALEAQLGTIDRLVKESAQDRARAQQSHDRLQAQLQRALRLESLGQLTGGIAHDFNNLLGIITNFASYVSRKLRKDALSAPIRSGTPDPLPNGSRSLADDVDQITLAAERGSRLTHQLLAFARKEEIVPRAVDVNETIRSVTELLRRTLGSHLNLRVETASEPLVVIADQGQLEQVLLNLAINARDAMLTGGTLAILGDATVLDAAGDPSWPGMVGGEYARIRVSDQGVGMPGDVVERAFDPFFTTKPVGQGSGLGLTTVYGIVTGADGQVSLASSPGEGTTVTVLLPIVPSGDIPSEEPDLVAVANSPPEDETAKLHVHAGDRPGADNGTGNSASRTPEHLIESEALAGRTVLLVEDEPSLREAIRRTLADYGLEVLTAHDGTGAVSLASSRTGTINALLTDVLMPGMPGTDVAASVRAIHPEAAVIYMSGHLSEVAAAGDTSRCPILCKPFTEHALLEAMAQALTASAASPGMR